MTFQINSIQHFWKLDTNKDGRISEDESKDAVAAYDTDDQGKTVELWEYLEKSGQANKKEIFAWKKAYRCFPSIESKQAMMPLYAKESLTLLSSGFQAGLSKAQIINIWHRVSRAIMCKEDKPAQLLSKAFINFGAWKIPPKKTHEIILHSLDSACPINGPINGYDWLPVIPAMMAKNLFNGNIDQIISLLYDAKNVGALDDLSYAIKELNNIGCSGNDAYVFLSKLYEHAQDKTAEAYRVLPKVLEELKELGKTPKESLGLLIDVAKIGNYYDIASVFTVIPTFVRHGYPKTDIIQFFTDLKSHHYTSLSDFCPFIPDLFKLGYSKQEIRPFLKQMTSNAKEATEAKEKLLSIGLSLRQVYNIFDVFNKAGDWFPYFKELVTAAQELKASGRGSQEICWLLEQAINSVIQTSIYSANKSINFVVQLSKTGCSVPDILNLTISIPKHTEAWEISDAYEGLAIAVSLLQKKGYGKQLIEKVVKEAIESTKVAPRLKYKDLDTVLKPGFDEKEVRHAMGLYTLPSCGGCNYVPPGTQCQ